jgi:hypothetical protein
MSWFRLHNIEVMVGLLADQFQGRHEIMQEFGKYQTQLRRYLNEGTCADTHALDNFQNFFCHVLKRSAIDDQQEIYSAFLQDLDFIKEEKTKRNDTNVHDKGICYESEVFQDVIALEKEIDLLREELFGFDGKKHELMGELHRSELQLARIQPEHEKVYRNFNTDFANHSKRVYRDLYGLIDTLNTKLQADGFST